MGDLRVRYGISYGRQNNFYTGVAGQKGYLAGTDGLFAQGNTAPDITYGVLFYTNNSSATVINSFTLSHPSQGAGNLAGLFEGKEIKIVFLDSNTTIAGSKFNLVGTDNAFGANSFLELIYHNSAFYETGRSNVYSNFVSVTVGASQGLNANFVTSYTFSGGSSITIQSISNGMIGQRLLLINSNTSNTPAVTISTAGNISYSLPVGVFAGSGIYTILSNGVTELVKTSGGGWGIIGR